VAAIAAAETKGKGPGQEKEVGAVEDLMREHGVLRRALLVYRETALKLRSGGATEAAALNRTARLFRSFGEDYHEKKLEEAHIFPLIRKIKGPAARYPDVLTEQHNRGREITEYILTATSGTIEKGNAETLSHALETFVTMYQNHAAREDTIVFPAWKTALSQHHLDELGEKFEEIEKQQFGHDGYEDAVKQIGEIETTLGLAELAQFTPPPPPRS
jgi:hemerythrin-like domain-containing protein